MATDDKEFDPDNGPNYRPTIVAPQGTGSARRTSPRQAPAPRASPTVMTVPVRAASGNAVAQGQRRARPSQTAVRTPTAVPGVERKRIAIDIADLARLSPGAKRAVLEEAVRQAQAFAIPSVRERDIILWGHRLQQDYSDLASRALELGQAEVLSRVRAYLRRMAAILESVDTDAIGGGASQNMMGRYLRRTNARIDTEEELGSALREVEQLLGLMGDALERLLMLKEDLQQHSRQINELGDAVEAAALAMTFLSTRARDEHPALSKRLVERSMSLTQTLAQLRESKSVHDLYLKQPLDLISAIQNVALVSLPGLLGSMAAMIAVAGGHRRPTPTEVGELQHRLRATLQQLKV